MEQLIKLLTEWYGIASLSIVALLLIIFLYKLFFKRFFDIIFSFIALIVLSPVILIVGMLVRIKLGVPIIFSQPRPLKHGKVKNVHKFRSMTNQRDNQGNLLTDGERLTSFGKLLRSLSLDELPQLWDILIGRLSIIGPRPLLESYLPLYNEEQKKRHNVRPGLTGLAQVNGRNAISWEEKFEFDIYYIKHLSIWLDIKIFFKTLFRLIKRNDISQKGQATMEYFFGNRETNILILSAGRRVELVKAFIAARKRLELKGKVYSADASSTAPALMFGDERIILPRIEEENYLEMLEKVIEEKKIHCAIPTIDTELMTLVQNKIRIEMKYGCKILISDLDVISICRDKLKTAAFLKTNGFLSPEIITDFSGVDFPLFIKPSDGSSSINAFKVNNKKELDFFLDYIPKPIVQEYVSGTEYSVDLFCGFDSAPLTIVTRKRLAVRSGEILKGEIVKVPVIIEEVKRLAGILKFIGQITLQFILTEVNKPYLIEINPRFGGGTPMSIMAGADSCENIYRLLNGQKIHYNENFKNNLIISRFDDSVVIK